MCERLCSPKQFGIEMRAHCVELHDKMFGHSMKAKSMCMCRALAGRVQIVSIYLQIFMCVFFWTVAVCGICWGCVSVGSVSVWSIRSGVCRVLSCQRPILQLGWPRVQPLCTSCTQVNTWTHMNTYLYTCLVFLLQSTAPYYVSVCLSIGETLVMLVIMGIP